MAIRAINSVLQACGRAKIGTDSFGNARPFPRRAEVQFEGMETAGEREREKERGTDRQTDRKRQRDSETEMDKEGEREREEREKLK